MFRLTVIATALVLLAVGSAAWAGSSVIVVRSGPAIIGHRPLVGPAEVVIVNRPLLVHRGSVCGPRVHRFGVRRVPRIHRFDDHRLHRDRMFHRPAPLRRQRHRGFIGRGRPQARRHYRR